MLGPDRGEVCHKRIAKGVPRAQRSAGQALRIATLTRFPSLRKLCRFCHVCCFLLVFPNLGEKSATDAVQKPVSGLTALPRLGNSVYQGAKYGWQGFFANLEQVLAQIN
jgi:hypothetical protein